MFITLYEWDRERERMLLALPQLPPTARSVLVQFVFSFWETPK